MVLLIARLQMGCFDPIISKLIKSRSSNRLHNNSPKALGWMLLPHDRKDSSIAWIQMESQDLSVFTLVRHQRPLLLQSVSAGLSEAVLYTLAGVTFLTQIQPHHSPGLKSSKAGPLSLGTADILGPIILSWDCPVLCRVVSSPPQPLPTRCQ